MATDFLNRMKSIFLTGTILFSTANLCYGTNSVVSTTTGDVSLVKIKSDTSYLPKLQTLSLRNYIQSAKAESHFFFLQNPTYTSIFWSYNPFTDIFHDFIHEKEDLSFAVLALQSPIYQTTIIDPVTQEEGKISLYDINKNFYVLCEKPFESQVLVELSPDFTLTPHDFHYLFRIDSICKEDEHLYIYLSEFGTDITFQREGDKLFYPLFQENLRELWMFFPDSHKSHSENTLDTLKTDFLQQADNQTEKKPEQTYSLEDENKSFTIFQQSYQNDHKLSIPRESTDDFRQEQERTTIEQRHTNTVEISEKDQRERSTSAYIQDFQGNLGIDEENETDNIVLKPYSFENWETAHNFYENILFQSLMIQLKNQDR